MDNNIIDFKNIKKLKDNGFGKDELLEALKESVEHFYHEEELDRILNEKQSQGIELVSSDMSSMLLYGKYLCAKNTNIHYTELSTCTSLKSNFIKLKVHYRDNTLQDNYKAVAFMPHDIMISILYYLVNRDIIPIDFVF